MNGLEIRSTSDSTSAAGSMLTRPIREPVLIGSMLAGLGTSTAYVLTQNMVLRSLRTMERTTSGAAVVGEDPAGAAVGELRRLSGFTWDQLARIFSVSRRSLHFWASGKPMTPGNEERLQRLLSVVRKIDRGSAAANRAALLGVREDGSLPFDLLAAGDYERVLTLLGQGEKRRAALPRLSAEARATRTPPPPDELVGALQDRIHPTSGRLRAAKAIIVSRRK